MTEPQRSGKDTVPPRTSSELVKLVEHDDNSGGVAVFRTPNGETIYSHYVNVSRDELKKLGELGDYSE